jgi:phage terminase small subunit
MGVLENSKHETFAQELAKGHSAGVAYALAGYKKNDGNSIRMKGNERIKARVRELKERVAKRVIINEVRLLEELTEVSLAKPEEAVTYHAKMKAIELSGKHLGMFKDKVDEHSGEIKIVISEREMKL